MITLHYCVVMLF